jgi:hypothetical protein
MRDCVCWTHIYGSAVLSLSALLAHSATVKPLHASVERVQHYHESCCKVLSDTYLHQHDLECSRYAVLHVLEDAQLTAWNFDCVTSVCLGPCRKH